MSYIVDIATAVPGEGFEQRILTQFYSNSTGDTGVKRKVKILADRSGTTTRYSVLSDFGLPMEQFTFFPKNAALLPSPGLSQRMAMFKQEALPLSLKAIRNLADFENRKNGITHLITVTCTGLSAPGLDIELIQALDLLPTTHRSSVNFLGCNAAIIALKQADSICKNQPDAKVLVVCTELCTLHFQTIYNEDYLLCNVLFGDGSAAVLLSGKEVPGSYNAKINGFDSFCIPDSRNEMAWQLSETGFIMNLTAYVGELIKNNIKQMLDNLSVDLLTVDHWAVHPGGKKIVDNFGEAMGLSRTDLAPSYQVLKEYGNMSSPTVLFVLKIILEKLKLETSPQNIFAAAFGPGLTVETMQLSHA